MALPGGTLFRNREFLLLWFAYGISALGDHLTDLGLLATMDALHRHDATRLTALKDFLMFLPFVIVGPLMGTLADRWPRRRLMVLADLFRAGTMFLYPLYLALRPEWTGWGAYFPVLLVGTFTAMFSPARQALLPNLVRPDQLTRANGMFAPLGIIATFFAIKAGGWLANEGHITTAFVLDGSTFAASAVILLMMRPPRDHSTEVHRREDRFRDGLRYVLDHRRVMQLILIGALVWGCGATVKSVIPALVRDCYGGDYEEGDYEDIANYMAFLGMGLVAGAVVVTLLGDALRREVGITWGLMGIGLFIAVVSGSSLDRFAANAAGKIGMIGFFGSGFFGSVVLACFNALLQRIVPDAFRGRVMGVSDVVTVAALLLATGGLAIPQWANIDQWIGGILLTVAILTFSAGMLTLVFRSRSAPVSPLNAVLINLVEMIAKTLWRFKRMTRCTVPAVGPAIVTGNHRSYFDPLVLYAACRYRLVSWMVAEEYTRIPIIAWFLRRSQCIPVRRDGRDSSATKTAMRHLKNGGAMGIFIEGGIPDPGEKPSPKDGVAMLALRTGAPVIPVYIGGMVNKSSIVSAVFSRHRARVWYGRPVDLSEFAAREDRRQAAREATDVIYQTILELGERDRAYLEGRS